MYQRSDVREGMTVRSIDGEKLGRVFAIQEGEFLIEKGLFFPKDYICRYSEISDIRDGEIILLHGQEGLRRFALDEERTPLTANASAEGVERPLMNQDEVRVPVHKEEVDVIKRDVPAGEVRVHKEVVEEEQVLKVPVRREHVRVERQPTQERPAMGASFQEETVVVPLRAEEVEVQKRAVVDEEVVIRKDAIEEEKRVAETARHEEVEIRGEGDVEGPRKLDLSSEDPTPGRS